VRAGVRKKAHTTKSACREMAGKERQDTAMVRNIDVRTEVRKITSSKPVHAAAGIGVLATQTLRQLPGRVVRGLDGTVTSLPARATGYVTTVRTKAADGYDALADRGKKALNGQGDTEAKNALNGRPSGSKSTSGSKSK
jgi:hypothetical protein